MHNSRVEDCLAMDAMFFVLRTGCRWNALNRISVPFISVEEGQGWWRGIENARAEAPSLGSGGDEGDKRDENRNFILGKRNVVVFIVWLCIGISGYNSYWLLNWANWSIYWVQCGA
jgi:hypothetical protein